MPIYEYKCDECGFATEVIQNISDPPLKECSKCSGQLKKQFSPPAIIFKGSGWYVTDYPTQDRKEGMRKETGTADEKSKESNTKIANTEKAEVKA